MRLIDIYKQVGDTVRYVTGGCIQTGEPSISRAPIVRSYTMADGSPVVYPAARDTVTATVEMECTASEAAAIERLVSGAHIIFAGLKLGALLGYDAQDQGNFPPTSPIPCIITGAVEVGEKFAKSGIYFASIPVQLIVGVSGYPDTSGLTLPVIYTDSISLNGETDFFSGYQIEKRTWLASRPVFFSRSSVYFTALDSISVGYACAETSAAPVSVTLYKNGIAAASAPDASGSFTVPLDYGENVLVLAMLGAYCRPFYVRLTAFRQKSG